MADITQPSAGSRAGGFRLPTLKELDHLLRASDIGLAVGVMAIIVVLILPLPPFLLDILLAISIVFSVLVLMTSLFIQAPLEFSSFPTVLLIAAMMRLALNLATTRLILSNGHNGPDHRHHQGFGPHRRSRGALQPRRHARQADGDRRRSQRRPHR